MRAVEAESTTIDELFSSIKAKSKKAIETLNSNGGMCINCGENKAEIDNPKSVSPFHCSVCNAETEELIKGIDNPGFIRL